MYVFYVFCLIHITSHVSIFGTNLPASKTEIPKPIETLVFEELDTSNNRYSKKLKWHASMSKKPSIVDIALEVAAREGINAMTDLYQNIEPQIVKNGQVLEDNHPAALLSKFSAPAEGNERSAMAAFATLSATKAFRRNNKESTVLGRQAQSQKVSFRRTPLEGLCPPRDPPTCMPASQRYRTHDGTCNNRRRLRWGSAQMPFNRFLPPEYGDGVDSIRGSVEGGALSSARFVSLLVHGAREGDAPLTLMIVQWGQLLDHDLTSTAQPRPINGSVPSCCGSKDFHPLCFPIKVPLDDPWLAPLKVRCLEFLRSAPAQRRDCVLSWREQTNQVTSFIDASPIYSSNAKTSDNARIFRNGLLIYGRGDPADDVCMRGAIAHQCIRSGDGRSGEQPGLLALHHVWVGEHNRIAMELSILNPHWSDEKVYQETRRIVGALFQHITFREFLPIVLGREVCKLFDLELVKSGYYTGYDPNINPSVSNAFAAAAFRFGHSLVQNSYMRCDRNHNFINNNVTLHEEFQQGDIGTAGSLHRLLRGMATQKALKRDEFITPELTNHLFQTPGFPFGLDLAAINIQRGRDHGIAPYTAWRQPCGLSTIDSWDDLSNVVGPESAKRISHAYRNVHDIDLFVGGIAERPVIGGLVGPTFACIIAQQFSNSRKGDRFWYENSGFESSFTPAQLNSLRHVSLSSVLCRAINGGTLQPYVFLPNDVKGNQRIKCGKDSLEPIDLRPWLEQDPFLMSNEKIDNNISAQSTPISTPMTITKEEKGINNRIQNVTMVANVDFIPNSSIGFHRVTNMTKIHDKLDMAQKIVSRPIVKPIRGISNKLDKQRLTLKTNTPKPTASSLSKRISTTRRTVVIHNVQIELRNANGASKETTETNKKTDKQTNLLASTAQNTIMKVAGVVKSQISAAMGFLNDNRDDDHTNHLSRKMNDQSKKPQRLTNFSNINNETEHRNAAKTHISNNMNKHDNDYGGGTKHFLRKVNDNSKISPRLSNVPNMSDETDFLTSTQQNFSNNMKKHFNDDEDGTNHLPTKTNDKSKTSPRLLNLTNISDETEFLTTTQINVLKNMNKHDNNDEDGTKHLPTKTNDQSKTSPRLTNSLPNMSSETEFFTTTQTNDFNDRNKHDNDDEDGTKHLPTKTNDQSKTSPRLTNSLPNMSSETEFFTTTQTNDFNDRNKHDNDDEDGTKHLPRKINGQSKTSLRLSNLPNLSNETYVLTTTQANVSNNMNKHYNDDEDDKTQLSRKINDQLTSPRLSNLSNMSREIGLLTTTQTNVSKHVTNNFAVTDNDYEKALKQNCTNIDCNDNSSRNENKTLTQNLFSNENKFGSTAQNNSNTSFDQANQTTTGLETNSNNLKESHDAYKDFQAIINSALQDSLEQHKRVHRKTDHNDVQVEKVELNTNLDFVDKLRTLRLDKTDGFPKKQSDFDLNENEFTEADDLNLPINTEQTATLRNVELRQFQERPIYNRPQKLILDAPKSDQYEIEINIRQTNTKSPQNNANYEDYNIPNKRYDDDRYNQNYDYTNSHQNAPSNSFFTPTTRIPFGSRTKPPTIIYLDEHDERTTTRAPGIFQNIISFATNSFNSIKPQTTSTESPFHHNPNRIVNNGQNSASENYLHPSRPYQHLKPSSGSLVNAQQAQSYLPTQAFPQHVLPQIPPNYNSVAIPPPVFPHQNVYPPQHLPGANSFSTASNINGFSHASSNAISTGQFGTITGSASSSGGDSTFSFNIRPSPRPQLNLMSPDPAGIKPDYELLPQRWPQFSSTPSYAIPPKPMPSVESFEYPPNKHDPFSSYTRRPPPYFNKMPNNVFDPAYDDIGRSELTIDESLKNHPNSNKTNNNELLDNNDYDYNDDDVDTFGHLFKNDNAVEEQGSGKNDKIDYLKLAEQVLTNRTKLNTTDFDDNFVLPVLRRNDKFIEPPEEDVTATNLTTTEQKSLDHDIFAEDYDELLIGRSSFLDSQASYVAGQWNKHKKTSQTFPFAPIQILTKPERPDNWVIYDALDEKPLLPVQPDYNMETLVAAEIPMPIQKRKPNRTQTKAPQTTKSDDSDFSKDTTSLNSTETLTSGQPPVNNVKLILDETTQKKDANTTTSQSINLEFDKNTGQNKTLDNESSSNSTDRTETQKHNI